MYTHAYIHTYIRTYSMHNLYTYVRVAEGYFKLIQCLKKHTFPFFLHVIKRSLLGYKIRMAYDSSYEVSMISNFYTFPYLKSNKCICIQCCYTVLTFAEPRYKCIRGFWQGMAVISKLLRRFISS